MKGEAIVYQKSKMHLEIGIIVLLIRNEEDNCFLAIRKRLCISPKFNGFNNNLNLYYLLYESHSFLHKN